MSIRQQNIQFNSNVKGNKLSKMWLKYPKWSEKVQFEVKTKSRGGLNTRGSYQQWPIQEGGERRQAPGTHMGTAARLRTFSAAGAGRGAGWAAVGALAFDASKPLDALSQWSSAPRPFYKFPDNIPYYGVKLFIHYIFSHLTQTNNKNNEDFRGKQSG